MAAGRARELDDRGTRNLRRRGRGQLDVGTVADVRGTHRDELDLAVRLRESVLRLVGAVECGGEMLLQRHGQLERLAGVAEVGLA